MSHNNITYECFIYQLSIDRRLKSGSKDQKKDVQCVRVSYDSDNNSNDLRNYLFISSNSLIEGMV